MVPNLPYFMVQFDYKGERGYGHVIEGTGGGQDDPEGGVEEGEKGGGEFPRCVVFFLFCFVCRFSFLAEGAIASRRIYPILYSAFDFVSSSF